MRKAHRLITERVGEVSTAGDILPVFLDLQRSQILRHATSPGLGGGTQPMEDTMEGATIMGLIITALVLAMCWTPTRLLLIWAALITGAVALAMAVGPVWFIAILLVLLLLK